MIERGQAATSIAFMLLAVIAPDGAFEVGPFPTTLRQAQPLVSVRIDSARPCTPTRISKRARRRARGKARQ
ncbi:MAG TPA: hypothetical protein VF503_09070 [Sphingobium sp.]|uniref:hypothetical protein n=1 Tax=Sphingobium sp. TaxID=1912891 RepID=UPI002ED1B2A5